MLAVHGGLKLAAMFALMLPALVAALFIPFREPPSAEAFHAQTGDWRLSLQRLYINTLDERNDEPYLAVIGFTSKFGVAGSTRIIWRRAIEELHESANEDGIWADIPTRMGTIDFGTIEEDDHTLGVVGAVVVAMEHDTTYWGTAATVFDRAAEEIRSRLVALIEREEFQLGGDGSSSTSLATEISTELSKGFNSALVEFLSPGLDNDDVVASQVVLWTIGLEATSPLACGARPWESGGVTQLGETVFDRGCNSLRFDGSVLGDSPAMYEVTGYLTSLTPRAGDLDEPKSGSNWWGNVDLSVELCVRCHRVTQVRYFAHYDKGDGRGPQDYLLAIGDPQNSFRAAWGIGGVPTQRATVWAELDTLVGTATTRVHSQIGLNVDTIAPSGSITSPANGGFLGNHVRITAQVTDSQSGVDRVEFWYNTGAGQQAISQRGTPANGFSIEWTTYGTAEGPVTIGGTAFDKQGNQRGLGSITGTFDHTPPTVSSVYPSADQSQPSWITSSTSTIVRARAADTAAGIREVRFTAFYRDANGSYRDRLIGTAGVPNVLGDYSVSWDVSAIPDQADRTPPYDLFVLAAAQDHAGNVAIAGGWVAGFDRAAPAVRVVSPNTTASVTGGTFPIEVTATDALGPANRVAQLTVTARYRDPGAATATSRTLASLTDVTGWSGTLDLTNLPDQTVTITAEARDNAGQRGSHGGTIVIDRTAPVISGVSHAPDPFHANGTRTASFSYQLSERADAVSVAILDSSGNLVRELRSINVNTDPKVVLWDGRNAGNSLVPSGVYRYRITAIDRAGNQGATPETTITVIVDTSPPVLSLALAPSPFSLSSGRVLNLRYQQNEAARAEIEVLNSAGQVIRYLGAWQEQAGVFNRTWDGANASGAKVPTPATYTIRLRATDLSGNTATTTATVLVQP